MDEQEFYTQCSAYLSGHLTPQEGAKHSFLLCCIVEHTDGIVSAVLVIDPGIQAGKKRTTENYFALGTTQQIITTVGPKVSEVIQNEIKQTIKLAQYSKILDIPKIELVTIGHDCKDSDEFAKKIQKMLTQKLKEY